MMVILEVGQGFLHHWMFRDHGALQIEQEERVTYSAA